MNGTHLNNFVSAKSNNETFGIIDERSNEDQQSHKQLAATIISKKSKATSPSSFHHQDNQKFSSGMRRGSLKSSSDGPAIDE